MTNRTIAKVESLETLVANDLKPKDPADLRVDEKGVLWARLVPPISQDTHKENFFITPGGGSYVLAVPNAAVLLRASVIWAPPVLGAADGAGQKYVLFADTTDDPFTAPANFVDFDFINLAKKPVAKFDWAEGGGVLFGNGITIAIANLLAPGDGDRSQINATIALEWIGP